MFTLPRIGGLLLVLFLSSREACIAAEAPQHSGGPRQAPSSPRERQFADNDGARQATDPQCVLDRFKAAADGGLLLLPVTLQGKRYFFALDTGASDICYHTSLRSVLGESIGTRTIWTPDGNMTVPVYRAPLGKVGKLDLPRNSEAFCQDLRWMRELSGQEFDGFLGMDFLKKHVFRIDFDRGEVVFLRSAGPDPGQRVPVTFRGNHPFVPVEVEGMMGQGRFLVDTGAIGFGSGSLQSEAFDILARLGKLGNISKWKPESLSGSRTTRVGYLANISLGKYRHEKLTFDESNRNILGLSYWSRYVVTFDFPNSVIYLKKGRRFNEPEICNGIGLDLIRKQGQTLVTSVEKGSAAAQAGVMPRDVVLKIDGKIVSDMSLIGIIRCFSMEGKKSRLLVSRAEKELELTIVIQNRLPERKESGKK